MGVRVKFCCCCIDLRMGVLIWGYLGIVGATINYLESFLNPLMPVIINTLIFVGALIPSICLVVAIHKNIPDLILITLLSSLVGIIVLLVAPFVIPSLLPDTSETAFWSPEKREALNAFKDHLLLACWIAALIAVYFCIVVYSQFSAMKEEEENQNNTAANHHDMPSINTIA